MGEFQNLIFFLFLPKIKFLLFFWGAKCSSVLGVPLNVYLSYFEKETKGPKFHICSLLAGFNRVIGYDVICIYRN